MKKLSTLFYPVVMATFLAIPMAANAATGDEAITDIISNRIAANKYLEPADITVYTQNGVVTLRGTVEDLDQLHMAEYMAERVQGVKAIKNELVETHTADASAR